MSLDIIYFCVPDKVPNTTGNNNDTSKEPKKDGSIEKTDFAEIISELKEELFQHS